jgi:hypothetical protein
MLSYFKKKQDKSKENILYIYVLSVINKELLCVFFQYVRVHVIVPHDFQFFIHLSPYHSTLQSYSFRSSQRL